MIVRLNMTHLENKSIAFQQNKRIKEKIEEKNKSLCRKIKKDVKTFLSRIAWQNFHHYNLGIVRRNKLDQKKLSISSEFSPTKFARKIHLVDRKSS